MKKRIKKKTYKRAESKLATFCEQNHDTRSYYEIAIQESVLTSKEKAVFLQEQEKWIRFTQSVLDDITTEELETKHAAIMVGCINTTTGATVRRQLRDQMAFLNI